MIEVFTCEQGSPEWFQARLGIPTASHFGTVMAKGVGGKGPSLTRAKYMRALAAEIVSNEPTESYNNAYMERGKAQEAEARNLYAFSRDFEPQLVGFIKNGLKGSSPDALIGNDGMLEIKTRLGDLQVELLLADRFPPEHVAQVQGGLWVAEREWVDLAVYSRGLPLWVGRQYRDEDFIVKLTREVMYFNEELAAMVERIRSYGMPLKDKLAASLAGMA